MGSIKSISVSEEFSKYAEMYNLSWSECARIGASILLAEKGIDVFHNELNEKRQHDFKRRKIEALNVNTNSETK
jgi:hypothetical protein